MKFTKEEKEETVKRMLEMIGEDPSREGLKGTPERVVRMWDELFRGYDETQKPKITVFNNGADNIVYDEMLNDTGSFYSHCEHHMLPFFGKYYFAYIPNPKGKLIGLSKVARVVDFFSNKLQIQERLTHQILECLWKSLSSTNDNWNKPLGMGIVIEGEHLCKTMRGVKKKGQMRTTQLMGAFKTDPATKAEFLNWVNKHDK